MVSDSSNRLRRSAFARGVRAVAPATIATGTWGLVTGVAMVKIGLTTAQAIGMTLLVFAGSAQLAALPLIAAGAPVSGFFLAWRLATGRLGRQCRCSASCLRRRCPRHGVSNLPRSLR